MKTSKPKMAVIIAAAMMSLGQMAKADQQNKITPSTP